MGAMGMDMSMHKMPIIGNFFVNPQEQFKQEQFQRGAEALGAYRPEYAQARMNALMNQSNAYQSANNLLGHMSGGQGGFRGGAQMARTPMGPGMLSVGQQASLTTPHGQTAQNGNGSGMMGALFGSGGGPQGLMGMGGGGGFGGLLGGL